ncbi:MAG TPA: rod shape-determining protein RodA [Steroidobacteraceae bacterium]|jgi:rod shape determining protein RodA|nr:rod shape-determining protein RodA [Steroidobacteraceae bacterium]
MIFDEFSPSRARRTLTAGGRTLRALGLDGPLTGVLALIVCIGILVVYSASGQNIKMVEHHLANIAIAVIAMLALARLSSPQYLRLFSPIAYLTGILLLAVVAVTGHIGKGAQRWLDVGFIRFQPSEIMKLAVPMMCAWYMHERPLPPTFLDLIVMGILIMIPTAMVVVQPDLGTALLIGTSGLIVMLLAGMQFRIILTSIPLLGGAAFSAWHFIHDYQRQRILTFLNPETDRLGAGYHIIQSQIAIGSGGVFGKGYMNGSQAQLEFLPERSTDFIFAVIGEEFGLLGQLLILSLYGVVVGRALYLAMQGQDTFTRLTGGAIALSFFVYVFVNSGMVSGILPVVGVPLPLISYGGTSMVTLLAGFGILMSLNSHRKLIGS